MPKLVSYNTSWVNDCHPSQSLKNTGMTESSSILAKAIQLYNSKESNTEKINVEKDGYAKGDADADIQKLYSDEEIGDHFLKLRQTLNSKNNEFLKTMITGDENADFLALIEQMIHVDANNSANYDDFLANPFDVGEENVNYGILKRLKDLGVVEDIVQPSNNDKDTQQYTHACVYDNIVNGKGNLDRINNPNKSGIVEGIAIVYRKNLFDEGSMAEWNRNDLPSFQKLQYLGNLKFKELNNPSITTKYYSDDSGFGVCNPKGIEEDPVFVSRFGASDGGRPIIMTAGMKGNDMVVLVAIHGPNIPNLYKYKDFKIWKESEKYEEYKKWKSTPIDETGKSEEELKKIQKMKEEWQKYEESIKGKPEPILFVAEQLKNQSIDATSELFDIVRTSISTFISGGLSTITNKDKFSNFNNSSNISIYLGGDFNDARGLILQDIIKTPFEIKFKINEDEYTKNVSFAGYSSLESQTKDSNDPITDTQGRYTSLYSCCANGDSLDGNYRTTIGKDGNPTINSMGNGKFDAEHLFAFSKLSENMKNGEFINPANYGYNGDYALYGSSEPNSNGVQNMVLYNSPSIMVGSFYPSDHLPVISRSAAAGGGRRRRRYSMRALKRHTKKGLLKKIRASRRKRRSHTYKNAK
jgi:hypothetical protein